MHYCSLYSWRLDLDHITEDRGSGFLHNVVTTLPSKLLFNKNVSGLEKNCCFEVSDRTDGTKTEHWTFSVLKSVGNVSPGGGGEEQFN
jgi:hypothetical protein